jgi:protease IV
VPAARFGAYGGPVPALPGRRPSLLLEVDFTAPLADPSGDDPLTRLRMRGRQQLRPALRALHEASSDRHVRGLVAKLGGPLPWTLAQELALGVRAFAASGKPTIAWAETFPEAGGAMSAYVLACAFAEIWLQPGGGLGPLGVGIETTFLRGALDKLGVEPQLEQRHEYKNAADRLMRVEFTEPHRQSLDAVAGSLFEDALREIAAGRSLDEAAVRALADAGPITGAEALRRGLVDRLGYRDEVYADARRRTGASSLLFADRWRPRPRPLRRLRRSAGAVALVEVRGALVQGRSRRGALGRQAGSDTVTAALRAAVRDRHVRAVVLLVDSPGGSAVASEAIWREVVRTRESGKSVVVSMGPVAASGGYYVACPADVVVALPATITASIGVFGGKVVVRQLLDRLGLTTGSVARGERALMFSARRSFSADERDGLAGVLDAIYSDFVAKVAAGRGRPQEEIEQIARGRVWTGRDARSHGLVDELGGLRDALRIARARAGLPDDAPVRRPGRLPPLARLTRPRNSDDPRAWLGSPLPDAAAALGDLSGVQLLMPAGTLS